MAKKFQSKIGLKPIYSTKDPNGNPATKGEEFAQITRDNLELLEENIESAQSSAEDALSVAEKAQKAADDAKTELKDQDNTKTDRANFVNVSQLKNKFDYESKEIARADVPEEIRARGQVLVYILATTGWTQEIFTGKDTSQWNVNENWRNFGGGARVFDGGRADTFYGGARHLDCGGADSKADGDIVDCGGANE